MIIDLHTHVSHDDFPEFAQAWQREPFTVDTLLRRMDMEGIDKSVVLPVANPENVDLYMVANNRETLRACRRYPDRLIPFVNLDPRSCLCTPKADLSALIRIYKDLGCKGIGEVCASLRITHPLYRNLFRHAAAEKMPVLFHFAPRRGGMYGVVDKLHLPGLEQVLREFPETVFVGHAPAFWNELDGDLQARDRNGYPAGPIHREGALVRLLAGHPNLYGDLSAGSGFNAISRDPEFGYAILRRFSRKLFFGTDRFTAADEPIPPMLPYLQEALAAGHLSRSQYEEIMHGNCERVILDAG